MIDGLTLGAYVLAPKEVALDASLEVHWYDLLGQIDAGSGLEIPFNGTFHPGGVTRMAKLLPNHWHIVATMLTRTIMQTQKDPRYGLASDSSEGRRAAIEDVRALFAEVQLLNQTLGREALRAIELPSAPRASAAVSSSSSALSESLKEVGGWRWGTTALVIEHCDALRPERRSEKGYLDVNGEMEAVLAQSGEGGATFGQSINWGRSVIEGRSVDTPVAHLSKLSGEGTLKGIFFSGAPGSTGNLGEAWTDLHNALDIHDPTSLLTLHEVKRSVGALDAKAIRKLTFVGVKVTNPLHTSDLSMRIEPLRVLSEVVKNELDSVIE